MLSVFIEIKALKPLRQVNIYFTAFISSYTFAIKPPFKHCIKWWLFCRLHRIYNYIAH